MIVKPNDHAVAATATSHNQASPDGTGAGTPAGGSGIPAGTLRR